MPSRLLREGIIDSEAVNKLKPPEEVFYRRLMSVVDDFGRFDGRPSVLRSRLYPLKIDTVREADITCWIAACVKAGLIALYSHDGKPYILFGKLGSPRAKESKFPPPPPEIERSQLASVNTCAQMKTDVNTCAQTFSDVPGSGSGSGSGTNTGSGSGANSCPEPPEAASGQNAIVTAEVPLIEYPTVGKDSKPWPLLPSQVSEWQAAYPGVDVTAECRKALAWCNANPRKQKTFSGMPKFLNGWLTKAQNDSGRQLFSHGKPATRGQAELDFAARMAADAFGAPQ